MLNIILDPKKEEEENISGILKASDSLKLRINKSSSVLEYKTNDESSRSTISNQK